MKKLLFLVIITTISCQASTRLNCAPGQSIHVGPNRQLSCVAKRTKDLRHPANSMRQKAHEIRLNCHKNGLSYASNKKGGYCFENNHHKPVPAQKKPSGT